MCPKAGQRVGKQDTLRRSQPGSELQLSRPPVIVTDAETRSALAAVRSLGAAGIPVHAVAARRRSLAGASRFTSQEHRLPAAEAEPRAWGEALERLARSLPGSLVLPVTEVALGTIYAFGVDERIPVAAPDRTAYERVTDKHELMRRAQAVGLATPRTTFVEDVERLQDLPAPHRYPVVLKARRSRWLAKGRWHSGSIHVVTGEAELREAARFPGLASGALLQEYVPGHGEGLFFLLDRGQVRVRFAHRRLREKPPWGGVSVLSESIAPDPELAAGAERLLSDLGWHGVAMVEFRRSPEGRAFLMEVNPRLWGSLQLAIDSGVDFPRLLVELHRGAPIPPVSARLGVRTRWLLGDLDHLAIALRRRAVRRALGRSAPALAGAFLGSFFDGTRLEVWRRDDRGPFWAELCERFRKHR